MGCLVSKRLDFDSPKLSFDLKRDTILFFVVIHMFTFLHKTSCSVCALNVYTGCVFECERMLIETWSSRTHCADSWLQWSQSAQRSAAMRSASSCWNTWHGTWPDVAFLKVSKPTYTWKNALGPHFFWSCLVFFASNNIKSMKGMWLAAQFIVLWINLGANHFYITSHVLLCVSSQSCRTLSRPTMVVECSFSGKIMFIKSRSP